MKCTPARARWRNATAETAAPSPVTILITPGGRPAAASNDMVWWAASCWAGEGFQTTVLPMIAGAVGRFAATEVKLNGVTARTKPSSGR